MPHAVLDSLTIDAFMELDYDDHALYLDLIQGEINRLRALPKGLQAHEDWKAERLGRLFTLRKLHRERADELLEEIELPALQRA